MNCKERIKEEIRRLKSEIQQGYIPADDWGEKYILSPQDKEIRKRELVFLKAVLEGRFE